MRATPTGIDPNQAKSMIPGPKENSILTTQNTIVGTTNPLSLNKLTAA